MSSVNVVIGALTDVLTRSQVLVVGHTTRDCSITGLTVDEVVAISGARSLSNWCWRRDRLGCRWCWRRLLRRCAIVSGVIFECLGVAHD